MPSLLPLVFWGDMQLGWMVGLHQASRAMPPLSQVWLQLILLTAPCCNHATHSAPFQQPSGGRPPLCQLLMATGHHPAAHIWHIEFHLCFPCPLLPPGGQLYKAAKQLKGEQGSMLCTFLQYSDFFIFWCTERFISHRQCNQEILVLSSLILEI